MANIFSIKKTTTTNKAKTKRNGKVDIEGKIAVLR